MHKTLAEKLAAAILARLRDSIKDEIRDHQEETGVELSDMEKAIIHEIVYNKLDNLVKEADIQL